MNLHGCRKHRWKQEYNSIVSPVAVDLEVFYCSHAYGAVYRVELVSFSSLSLFHVFFAILPKVHKIYECSLHSAQQQMYAHEKNCVRIVNYYTTHCVLRLSLSQMLCRYLNCISFLCSRRWREKNRSIYLVTLLLRSTEGNDMGRSEETKKLRPMKFWSHAKILRNVEKNTTHFSGRRR